MKEVLVVYPQYSITHSAHQPKHVFATSQACLEDTHRASAFLSIPLTCASSPTQNERVLDTAAVHSYNYLERLHPNDSSHRHSCDWEVMIDNRRKLSLIHVMGALCVFVVASLVGCRSQSEPEKLARAFFKALEEKDCDMAASYMAPAHETMRPDCIPESKLQHSLS